MSSVASDDDRDVPQVGQATQNELYNAVFGGGDDDSDLSELSDDEDEPRQTARRAFPPRPSQPEGSGSPTGSPSRQAQAEEDAEDQDEDEVDDGDAYVPGTAAQAAKIPKFKKKQRDEGDDAVDLDDDERDEERRRKRKRKEKKDKRRAREREPDEEEAEEPAPVYDETTQRRMALEERIDNIGKKVIKTVRRKRKDDEEVIDTYHDETCAALKQRMITAAEKDIELNAKKLPATAKLALLEDVMASLRNVSMWQAIVDNDVLSAVRLWLEPIPPSGALPAVGIQKAIFEILPKMDLDTQTLKECRLGHIVLFYTKTKRVSPAINRQADQLIATWARPIVKRPANFRSKHIETVNADGTATPGEGDEMDVDEESQPVQAPKRQKFNAQAAVKENRGRKGARLLINRDIQYTVAPQSRQTHFAEDMQHVSRIQMDNQKFNKFARKLQKRAN